MVHSDLGPEQAGRMFGSGPLVRQSAAPEDQHDNSHDNYELVL